MLWRPSTSQTGTRCSLTSFVVENYYVLHEVGDEDRRAFEKNQLCDYYIVDHQQSCHAMHESLLRLANP